nr:MAG TPA: hypothetical protein [Caudoviricetes sp.]
MCCTQSTIRLLSGTKSVTRLHPASAGEPLA